MTSLRDEGLGASGGRGEAQCVLRATRCGVLSTMACAEAADCVIGSIQELLQLQVDEKRGSQSTY